MKRVLALLVVAVSFSSVAASAADSSTVSGWISDSMCGAKHTGSGAACVKKCIDGGSAPVFVSASDKAVWKIDNPDAVKSNYYGSKVTVTGTVDKDAKTVHIDSIAEAK